MTAKQPPAQNKAEIRGTTNIAPPWEPCKPSKEEMQAIHALVAGTANKDQQGHFIEWLKRATAYGEMEFRPTSDRDSSFASGKRFVYVQFLSLARSSLPPTK